MSSDANEVETKQCKKKGPKTFHLVNFPLLSKTDLNFWWFWCLLLGLLWNLLQWGSISDAFRETNKLNKQIWCRHLCSVFMLSFTSFNILCLFSAARRTHPSCRSERTTQPWESVDTFLSESAALNFQRNVWADMWNWRSSGQPFIWGFCTNSHAYKDNCDCVKELLIFHMWTITGSLKCHFRQSLLLSTIKKIKKKSTKSTSAFRLLARTHLWWLIIPSCM